MDSNKLLRSLHGAYLGYLHVHDTYVAWPVCRAPSSATRTSSWNLVGFGKPVTYAGLRLPAFLQWEELGLTSTF